MCVPHSTRGWWLPSNVPVVWDELSTLKPYISLMTEA